MSQAEALQLIEDHLWQVVVGVLVLLALLAVLRGRGKLDQLRDEQARQRAVGASLGLETPGRASRDDPVDHLWSSLAMGPEKLGPFPRFAGHERVQIQFEGERDGMKTTIALHTLDSETTPPDRSTLACFASPDFQFSAFDLKPAVEPMGPLAEAIFDAVEKALIYVRWLSKPVPPIEFPGRTFNKTYTLDSDFTVSIRDDFDARVLAFFEKNPGWKVQGVKGRLLIWRERVTEPTERIPAFLSETAAVAQVFRRPLNQDL